MAKINLLPWRAELRKEKQKEFAVLMGIAAVLAVVVWGMIHFYHVQLIDNQKGRNKYLEEQIALLDKKIEELNQLESEKQRLLDKMQAIEQLQSNRPLIVTLFDALVATLPDGVSLLNFTQKGNSITVIGVAQSNARVSSYMRNIENSKVLKEPKLDVIQTKDEKGQHISTFTLHFNQILPTIEGGGGS
jgi:type IV pilus assembly protein PilN